METYSPVTYARYLSITMSQWGQCGMKQISHQEVLKYVPSKVLTMNNSDNLTTDQAYVILNEIIFKMIRVTLCILHDFNDHVIWGCRRTTDDYKHRGMNKE